MQYFLHSLVSNVFPSEKRAAMWGRVRTAFSLTSRQNTRFHGNGIRGSPERCCNVCSVACVRTTASTASPLQGAHHYIPESIYNPCKRGFFFLVHSCILWQKLNSGVTLHYITMKRWWLGMWSSPALSLITAVEILKENSQTNISTRKTTHWKKTSSGNAGRWIGVSQFSTLEY